MRRNSTNPRRSLDRRKSTSSAKQVQLEHILPETAENDAQSAATLAFERARARSKATTTPKLTLWPPLRTGPPPGFTPLHLRSQSEETPPRQEQSIRFVQPRPPVPAPVVATTHPDTILPMSPASEGRPIDKILVPRPAGSVTSASRTAPDYFDALFMRDEHYTPQDGVASLPSSYRKLRKSRSMFTNTANQAGNQHQGQSNSSATPNQLSLPTSSSARALQGEENIPPHRLKAPRSMSFLRDIRGTLTSGSKSEDYTTQFSYKRDGIQDRPPNRLLSKPSMIFNLQGSKTDRVLRRTMRETSNDTSIWSDNKAPKDGSLRFKARQVSLGLKYKLKNLFGKGKEDTDGNGIPLQHIDSQRSHSFGFDDLNAETDNELIQIPSDDEAALSYVTSGIPSLHAVPSYQQLHSQQGSMESLCSEQKASDDRSRVTSWSDSDANTVITQSSARDERQEREKRQERFDREKKKRLSIINEHGAHVCSSSSNFVSISENPSSTSLDQAKETIPAAMDPDAMDPAAAMAPAAAIDPAAAPTPVQPAVDGRRIYSALMKRMDQQEPKEDQETPDSDNDSLQPCAVPPRESSLGPRRHRRSPATSTIRYVLPDSESETESFKTARRSPTKVRSPTKIRYALPSIHNSTMHRPSTSRGYGEAKIYPTSMYTSSDVDEASPRKKDDGKVSALSKKKANALIPSATSHSSAFFGSPTRHLFRTESPYRRALQDQMSTTSTMDEEPMKSPDFNPWNRSLSNLPNLQLKRSSTFDSDVDIKQEYTESVYSTNTEEEQARRRSRLSINEDTPRPKSPNGAGTIFVEEPEIYKKSKERVTSSSSSVEWKMFLSSYLSNLEDTTKNVNFDDFQSGLGSGRSSGHVQENAQITDDDDDLPVTLDASPRLGLNDGFSHYKYKNTQPRPFDAGETDTTIGSRFPSVNHLPPASSSTSNLTFTPPRRDPLESSVSLELMGYGGRNKNLPRPPPYTSQKKETKKVTGAQENKTSRIASIPTKLMKRLPKPKMSMESLRSRSRSQSRLASGETQPTKSNGPTTSRPKMYSLASNKSENISPVATSNDDPYGIEGSGVLGPQHDNVGSKRMVDLFLNSRRRRMASDDEGSVFL
ncbi:hypothetical protein F4808DRAFT_475948 [Astrocystis sublimbata]|nr:hypothetical protein F4808DRAFT_475948 [Astrocystis sublimbata]